MKRPILIITLGFIMGIIWGLYLDIVPFVFILSIVILIVIKNITIKSNSNYFRILKLFLKNNVILIFLISAVLEGRL